MLFQKKLFTILHHRMVNNYSLAKKITTFYNTVLENSLIKKYKVINEKKKTN